MNAELKISIDGQEQEVPEGVEAVGEEDLYYVPFDLIIVAEEDVDEDSNYHWSNPRKYTQGEGKGFGKQDMEELYADIKEEGLMCPLICRWVKKEEGVRVQVLDGERRYRSLLKQQQKNEKVWSRRSRAWMSALDVHAKIPCRIITGNDKEALKIAFMVSDRSVAWGEGATAKLVRKLRKCRCNDEEILELTKKSGQWLREMDRICELDELTFGYLTDAKINRALALKLADVKEMDRRHKYLHAAYDDAVSNHQEVVNKADEELLKAEEKEEVAEAEVEEAKGGDKEVLEQAETTLADAKEKTEQKRRQRAEASRPRAKTANLRNATTKMSEEGEEVGDDVAQPLRPGKIKKQYELIEALIKNEGKIEGTAKEVWPINVLQLVLACYKAIMHGEEDIIRVIKREKDKQGLIQDRLLRRSFKQEDDDEDEVAEEDEE